MDKKYAKSGILTIIIVFCLAILIIASFGITQFKSGKHLSEVQKVENLSHLVIKPQAKLFTALLDNNADKQVLTQNLNELSHEDFILEAVIYNSDGVLIAQSKKIENLVATKLITSMLPEEKHVRKMVTPLYANNKLLGFLQVHVKTDEHSLQSIVNQDFHFLYAIFIITVLATILLVSSLYYLTNNIRILKSKTAFPMLENKA